MLNRLIAVSRSYVSVEFTQMKEFKPTQSYPSIEMKQRNLPSEHDGFLLDLSSLSPQEKALWKQTRLFTDTLKENPTLEIVYVNGVPAHLEEQVLNVVGNTNRGHHLFFCNSEGHTLDFAHVKALLHGLYSIGACEISHIKNEMNRTSRAMQNYLMDNIVLDRIHQANLPFLTDLDDASFTPAILNSQKKQVLEGFSALPREAAFVTVTIKNLARAEYLAPFIQELNQIRKVDIVLAPQSGSKLGHIKCFELFPGLITRIKLDTCTDKPTQLALASQAFENLSAQNSKIKHMVLDRCELSLLSIPTDLSGIESLSLNNAKASAAFLTQVLEAKIPYLYFRNCQFREVKFPGSFAGIKAIHIEGAKNFPKRVIQLCRQEGVTVVENDPDTYSGAGCIGAS